MSDHLSDLILKIEVESQPLIVEHPADPRAYALQVQVDEHGREADILYTKPLALLRLLGMSVSESSMLVLSHLASLMAVIDERDSGDDMYHWHKWDIKMRSMFPSGTTDTLLAMLDRDGFIEHWGDPRDCRPTILGKQFLLECIGCLDLSDAKI